MSLENVEKISYNRSRPPLKCSQKQINLFSLPTSLRRMESLERERDHIKPLVNVSLRSSRSISKLLLIYLLLEDNTSLDAPVTKLSNGMDFISRLSKEQQAQYGPLEDKTSLRDISALPQQNPQPQKRSRSLRPSPARSSNTPLLNSKPILQAISSRGNSRGQKLAAPIIRKQCYLNSNLTLMLTSSDNGRDVCVRD